jgi:hypothetical protein
MVDPWTKAAECDRALQYTTDPLRRNVLTLLRDFWIAVANEKALGGSDLGALAEPISHLHNNVVRVLH